MESSGQRPAEPEVPLGDVAIATEIARAAAKGRGADRAPTLEQLLAAFGEHAPTDAARRRVRAALRMADLGVRPDLLEAEPGQRLMLLPPGGGRRLPGRALAGIAALVLVLVVAVAAAALIGSDSGGNRASDELPPGPTTAASTPAPAPATSATPETTTATPSAAEPGPTSTTDQQAQAKAEAQARAERRRNRLARERRLARQRRAAAARKTVTVRVDATGQPTFLCVDDGNGHTLFAGTLDGKQTFKEKRVRMNIGLASTRVTVNGNPLRIQGSPAGFDVTRRAGARELPSGRRPCA